MRLNWRTQLRGTSVTLRPYRRSNVSRYHAWMSDAALRELTASEELSLEEELANQRAWVDDDSSERGEWCTERAVNEVAAPPPMPRPRPRPMRPPQS